MPMTHNSNVPHVLWSPSRRQRRRAAATAFTIASVLAGAGAATALAPALPSAVAAAQQRVVTGQPATQTKSEARLELERQLAAAEAGGRSSEAATLRRRLTEGDFHPGDRIVLDVSGNLTVHDTIAVREGQIISVPTLPDISMRGALRPELNDYLTTQISRFVRDPIVRATALTRVSVSGAVARPGFYAVSADILLGDAVMHAGGPLPTADMRKTVVRRGTREILSKDAVQRAVRDGATLSQVGLTSGDEIVVGERKQRNWSSVILVTTGLITSIVGLIYLIQR
ncbi:MAG: polysaccharide biosynthesis/export family protein [Gemmatimonadaceae bacterium]